ncbi:hypothetical protein WJX72_006932 [[Myrmecia] bisecta]|uniref:Maltose/galactoside acetyltransferase domain-containing protein n=1 Tax=[Myrmecia] bisecta TaxID=41462 RepID=A0AAW1PKA6_9CHLO
MAEKTEKQKMLAGELYWSFGPELTAERKAARKAVRAYNTTTEEEPEKRLQLLRELGIKFDKSSPPFIEPPFNCDYGYNITMGAQVYMNFNCCILDVCPVKIGSRVLFGPNVQLYPPGHPTDPLVRNGLEGPEFGRPITIGDDCWIGGNAIILGGVAIGDGVTVGAGAVVTRDVEPWTVVGGNPARVIKHLAGKAA